jgi:hypothetical protein
MKPPNPAQATRLASMLSDNARVYEPIDGEFAETLWWLSAFLAGFGTLTPMVAPPAPKHVPQRALTGKQKAEARARAMDFILRVADRWSIDTPPPSMRQLWKLAKIEAPGVSRDVIRAARLPEWVLDDEVRE